MSKRLPPIGTFAYRDLVINVAVYGWRTGSKIVGCVHYTTYYRWRQLAELGREPYATWVPQFQADVAAAKERLE